MVKNANTRQNIIIQKFYNLLALGDIGPKSITNKLKDGLGDNGIIISDGITRSSSSDKFPHLDEFCSKYKSSDGNDNIDEYTHSVKPKAKEVVFNQFKSEIHKLSCWYLYFCANQSNVQLIKKLVIPGTNSVLTDEDN